MEKLFRPYDKEYMRMAMLKHEETFKEQVNELHRLYQIQKILMKSIGRSRKKEKHYSNYQQEAEEINRRQIRKLDLEQQPAEEEYYLNNNDNMAAEDSDDNNDNAVLEIMDESEIELTLGPTSYSAARRIISRKAEAPLTSDNSGPSFSSSSTGSSQIKRTNSQNHCRRETTRLELNVGCTQLGLVQVPDTTSSGYQLSPGKKNIVVNDHDQRSLKHPPWLFQVLSLNMTS